VSPVHYQHFPNPDKPEKIATKAPRHKAKPLVNITLRAFVSCGENIFFIKCKEITIKRLFDDARKYGSGVLE
jgi:hypothetical protein